MITMLKMGGYAGYVWTSFALTFVVLLWNLMLARRRYEAAMSRINRRRAASDAEFDT